MDCSICIATYKRPEKLGNLLDSLIAQVVDNDIEFEVIVVDNDVEKSAKKVCDQYFDKFRGGFSYLIQKKKNISLTRNLAVGHSIGKYILFIDDDETAGPNWIAELLSAMEKFKADGVFGRVIPIFETGIPLAQRERYSRFKKKSYLNGQKKPVSGADAVNTSTANCLIKSSIIKKVEGPFDPRYGITGGSDTHLFKKIRDSGNKLIYSYEADVSELVPRERTEIKWLMRRTFRCNNIYAKILLEEKGGKAIVFCLRSFIVAILKILLVLMILILVLPSKVWRVHWSFKIASNLGVITALFGYSYNEYR